MRVTVTGADLSPLVSYYRDLEEQRAGLPFLDRRHRAQDRPPRLAGPPRVREPLPKVGNRLEVPARARADLSRRDPVPGRPFRKAHSRGAAEADQRRRSDGQARNPAQRGRDRAQGHPGRGHGGHSARR